MPTKKSAARSHELRVAREQKFVEKQSTELDVHDLLHSIFWGKPKRDEMKQVWARLDPTLHTTYVNQMKGEVKELIAAGLTRLPRGN